MKVTCRECNDKGHIRNGLNMCPSCSGDGTVESVDVKIPLSDKIWIETALSDIMIEANNLFAERNGEYGNTFERHGVVIQAFFQDGITLKTENDFKRFGLLNSIVNKIARYCRNFEKGHPDSITDASIYCHMLAHTDGRNDKNGK